MPVNKASIDWTKVKNKPSTIAGFGITDALGNSQTWQSFAVGTARVIGTTYTNTTGKPIVLKLQCTLSATPAAILINGSSIGAYNTSTGNHNIDAQAVIPIGATYQVTNISPQLWFELR